MADRSIFTASNAQRIEQIEAHVDQLRNEAAATDANLRSLEERCQELEHALRLLQRHHAERLDQAGRDLLALAERVDVLEQQIGYDTSLAFRGECT